MGVFFKKNMRCLNCQKEVNMKEKKSPAYDFKICPICNFVHTFHNEKKDLQNLRKVVDFFLQQKNEKKLEMIPKHIIDAGYKVNSKTAKDLLRITNNDGKLICETILQLKKWGKEKKLNWSLPLVFKALSCPADFKTYGFDGIVNKEVLAKKKLRDMKEQEHYNKVMSEKPVTEADAEKLRAEMRAIAEKNGLKVRKTNEHFQDKMAQ